MPWVPIKEDEGRPNNGRLAFVMLLKEDQELRMRQIFKKLKGTNGLTKHVGTAVWMMEVQGAQKLQTKWKSKDKRKKP